MGSISKIIKKLSETKLTNEQVIIAVVGGLIITTVAAFACSGLLSSFLEIICGGGSQ